MASSPQLSPRADMAPGPRSDAGAKVCVACKLPSGIVIRGYAKRTEVEAVMGGGTREFDIFRWNGAEQRINGYAVAHGVAPQFLTAGGYALTPNVDKDLFDSWWEANRESEIVKRGLIFAMDRPEAAQSEALNRRSELSGFEPIDPANPGMKVKGVERAVSK